jgi:hypothetical protein
LLASVRHPLLKCIAGRWGQNSVIVIALFDVVGFFCVTMDAYLVQLRTGIGDFACEKKWRRYWRCEKEHFRCCYHLKIIACMI